MNHRRCFWLSIFLLLFLTPSCVGPFRLTKGLNDWNQNRGDRWVNEIVFVGMVVIPIYPLSIVLDALLFNSLEFWTGSNPIENDPPPPIDRD